jgi:iron complex transport system substrate-binding protein
LRALLLCLLLALRPALAAVTAVDDAGLTVTLAAPAQRIVSLAPHTTELLYAVGAGSKVVGVSEFSDYPPEAKRLPSVGGTATLDLERVLALKPDLVVVWSSGNSAPQVGKLRKLGVTIFESEPRDFDGIAGNLERLSRLTGTEAAGRQAATAFRARLAAIATAYRQRPPVGVLYQIWRDPLMTLNDAHLVTKVLHLCGGVNRFGKLPQLAPAIGIEAVLQANPEVIIVAGGPNDPSAADWQRFPNLAAVARGNVFAVEGDLMTRGGPRILDGAEILCKLLDKARARRPLPSSAGGRGAGGISANVVEFAWSKSSLLVEEWSG